MRIFYFPKLAWGNIIRNRKFEFPYLLTGICTVAMFYNMIFIASSKDIDNMPGAQSLSVILGMGTIVVALFSIIFLLYTNSFLTKRRQKELGLYNILGMEKRHIAWMMLWETLYTAMITVVGGLLVGILLSKLLLLALFRMLFYTVKFGFSVSPMAITWTIVLFCGIYFVAFLYHLLRVQLSKPVELLHGSNVGEKEPKAKWLLALFGLVTMGTGYTIAIITDSPLEAIPLFFLAVVLVIIGTYCLFTAGSIAVLKILKKKKSYYYQKQHFTSVSGMLYRMKQNAVGLANICILCTMVLVMVSTTVCMYIGAEDAVLARYPHDISFSQNLSDTRGYVPTDDYKNALIATAEANGRQMLSVTEVTSLKFGVVFDENRMGGNDDSLLTVSTMGYAMVLTADDYAAYNHTEKPQLQPGEVYAFCTDEMDYDTLQVYGKEFRVAKWLDACRMGDDYMAFISRIIYLVVPDKETLEGLRTAIAAEVSEEDIPNITWTCYFDVDGTDEEKISCFYAMTEKGQAMSDAIGRGESDTVESGADAVKTDVTGMAEGTDEASFDASAGENDHPIIIADCRQASSADFYIGYGGLLFLGLFLGALFLMATVLIIYYKQISEGYDDRERFEIMQKVGMSRQEVRRTIRSQIMCVFFLPLLGAVMHLAAAFRMITKLMAVMNLNNIPLFAWTTVITVAVFAAGYFLIYTLTARTYYKIVSPKA